MIASTPSASSALGPVADTFVDGRGLDVVAEHTARGVDRVDRFFDGGEHRLTEAGTRSGSWQEDADLQDPVVLAGRRGGRRHGARQRGGGAGRVVAGARRHRERRRGREHGDAASQR